MSLVVGLLVQPVHAQQDDAAAPAASAEDTSELQKIVDGGKLRVGVNPGFKPFSFLDENEQRVGVDIDIATQLAEALGVELDIVAPETFSDLVPMLVDEEIDLIIAGMSITFDRARTIAFTDPYFDTGISILMNVGASAALGLANAKDSASFVAAVRESGNEERLKIAVTEGKAPMEEAERRFPDAQIVGYPTNEEAVAATFEGAAHAMIHDEIFLKVWLNENESAARNRMVVLDPPIKPDFYGIALRQGDPDWRQLLDVFVRDLRNDDRVIGYLGEYLPGVKRAGQDVEAVPVFEFGDME